MTYLPKCTLEKEYLISNTMKVGITKTDKSKTPPPVHNSANESNKSKDASFKDERPETLQLNKMQGAADGYVQKTRVVQLQKKANLFTATSKQPIQMKPAEVKGTTHPVKKKGLSIMKGEKGKLLAHGTPLDVNPGVRLRSRRGPNQEMVGDYDTRGEHIYRWYLINDMLGGEWYIREGTFEFSSSEDAPEVSELSHPDKRTKRQSHYAVRFEVWYNEHFFDAGHEHEKVDQSGHMVMKDMSTSHPKGKPYYAYEQRGAKEVDTAKKTGSMGMTSDSRVTEDDAEGIRVEGFPFKAKYSGLGTENESQTDIEKRLRGQKRVLDSKRWVKYKPTEHRAEDAVTRFTKRKWIEILVTKKEFDYLKDKFEERKKGGFYSFLREARTGLGYDLATRCLSVLEDIALKRKEKEAKKAEGPQAHRDLQTGHAREVLDHFAQINKVTVKHKGEEPA